MATKDVVPTPQRGSKLTLTFGVVSVPIHLKPLAETASPVAGTGMCPTHLHADLKSASICGQGTPAEHILPFAEKVYGYPHPDDGHLVVVEREVFKALEERRDGIGTIDAIVEAELIDAAYIDKTYLLWPQRGGEQQFDLLAAALDAEGQAAVVSAVVGRQTRKLVIRFSAELGCLLAHTISFAESLRNADVELVRSGARARGEVSEKMLGMVKAILGTLDEGFDASEVEDRLTAEKQQAIRATASGQGYVAPPPIATPAEPVDLMAALEASLAKVAEPKKDKAKDKAKKKKAV